MKNIRVYFLFVLGILTFFSCKETEAERRQKSIEIMTTQTMGLAYLEEFKLEESEKEFLKLISLTPDEKLGYANLGLVYLRMGKYAEAEEQIQTAIDIDPKDADIRLLMATVYQLNGEREKAVHELEDALTFAPDHVKTLYDLAEIYSVTDDEASRKKRKSYLEQLVAYAPGNIVPQLQLTEILIKEGESDKALEQLEIMNKQFPEFPKEAVEYYNATLSLLRNNEPDQALISFTIFHNYIKVTYPFQSGISDLKGPGGSSIGFPLISYNRESDDQALGDKTVLDIIQFKDVTASSGLDIISVMKSGEALSSKAYTFSEAGDYDGDGDTDLYAGHYDPASGSFKNYLFNNENGTFSDVSEALGIRHSDTELGAKFTDVDNDGFLDLYIIKNEGNLLYRNAGKDIFKDHTLESKIEGAGTLKALFFDMDHDGDLDLFQAKAGANQVYRNNGDGTFLEQSKAMGLTGEGAGRTKDAAFGDFDDDGDIDLIVINEDSNNILYSNQRQGTFMDITGNSGLESTNGSAAIAVGDYNNDGFLDLFIGSSLGKSKVLYRNLEGRGFGFEDNQKSMFSLLEKLKVLDTEFFDFDNDGYLDIIVAGEPTQNGDKGLLLYHNEGNGRFTDVSDLLSEGPEAGRQLVLFDYDKDGDIDLFIAGLKGGVYLMRNDGGNMNHYLNMKLVGLRTGSAKNNYYGIGAKVEMRAGDLYQTMVVTDPNIYFGLGNRSKADILRITWTNGVPQNILLPDADKALIESQTLKGSCPFLYTWNGEAYEFVKDMTWRSALGMPLGIMGGTTKYAFADASDDYIKIPGDKLKPKNGRYSIQVTSELWETIYMDKIELVAVDHPAEIDVYVPEQFSPPPFPGMDIHPVNIKYAPISAVDGSGNDLRSYILEKDDTYISHFNPDKFQGITEMHDLILDPGNEVDHNKLEIFLNGWIFPTDASINVAISQSDQLQLVPPVVQVINKKGEWETVIDHLGFPMGKDKMVIADLSGKFLTKDHRIRIRTNMEIYWDHIFFAEKMNSTDLETTVLTPASADLHYRGFSKTYRKGGRYGPHWFDYSSVDTSTRWRDLTGNYTRYGNVLPLLQNSDNKYIISNAGDETSIEFETRSLPLLKEGWTRDLLIRSVGWVKDGDINTAEGSTVLPLPFHGMSGYPPSSEDKFPADAEFESYQAEYNTRIVSTIKYQNEIKIREKK
jgi:Tfp pilus assembly protein PilF